MLGLYGQFSFGGDVLTPFTPDKTLPIESTVRRLTLSVYDLSNLSDLRPEDRLLVTIRKIDPQHWADSLNASKDAKQQIVESLCSEGLMQKEGNHYIFSEDNRRTITLRLLEGGFADREMVVSIAKEDMDRIVKCFECFVSKT